ncbi:hypothetical protein DV737_g441, partial [Chaetothyriales sp. CBS 132003]
MRCRSHDERVYYWPWTGDCFCESQDFLTKPWNTAHEKGDNDEGNGLRVKPTEQFGRVRQKVDAFNELAVEIEAALANPKCELRFSRLREIAKKAAAKRQASVTNEPTGASMKEPRPSFIPPPKTDITPELINQSLSVQPQNTATISSVLIHIPQGVVTITFEMNGLMADSISVNASTSMMCGDIGCEPEPEIEIVPKVVGQEQGSNATAVADCLCIAVNMYNPNVINVYVLDRKGRVFSLASSNKIVNIDQLDLSQSVGLSLMPIPAGSQKREQGNQKREQGNQKREQGNQKREQGNQGHLTNLIPLRTRQVLKVGCGKACPFAYMRHVVSADGHTCGCVFEHAGAAATMGQRGVVARGKEWVAMPKEECEAIKCVDKGDKAAAVFNPFSKVCWCVEPDYQ